MRPIGHTDVLERLEAQLPPVVLLIGPEAVGKRQIAAHLAEHHGADEVDVRTHDELSVEAVRELQVFLATQPNGKFKVAILNLDGASSEALNALLKALEEPEERVRFILLASAPPLATVQSRAAVYPVGYLSISEVEQVLTEREGQEITDARIAALLSGGQMSRALAAQDLDFLRNPVTNLLTSVAKHDHELFWTAFGKLRAESDISEEVAALMKVWCVEARTGRWRYFSPEDTHGLHYNTRVVDRIAYALDIGVRPIIGIKMALLTAIEDYART